MFMDTASERLSLDCNQVHAWTVRRANWANNLLHHHRSGINRACPARPPRAAGQGTVKARTRGLRSIKIPPSPMVVVVVIILGCRQHHRPRLPALPHADSSRAVVCASLFSSLPSSSFFGLPTAPLPGSDGARRSDRVRQCERAKIKIGSP